jgi:chorismate--pyruvate lyase
VRPALLRWLRAPGSLSRRLAAMGWRFDVQTLQQGVARPLPGEARSLGAAGRRCLVREVVLRVDGVPLVWARTVVQAHAVLGPWRALRGLGTRPLADLLFRDMRVKRSPLRNELHRRGSRWRRHADSAWRDATGEAWPASLLTARSSVFTRRGARLRVFEAFAPAIASMRDRSPRRRTPRSRPSGSAERP